MNKVLFVLKRAGMGGSCASMINLLSLCKERGLAFDVFLMEHTGIWTNAVARYANLLPEDPALAAAIKSKDQLRGLGQYYHRIRFVLSHKMFGRDAEIARLYRTAAKKLSGKYDHVIAYQESETTEFASYIQAPHKVAWVHTDFERFYHSGAIEAKPEIYGAFDDIVCVTEASVQSVIQNLGLPVEHAHLIRNTLPETPIRERSREVGEDPLEKRSFCFLSVGRISPEKAYERIPAAAQILKAQGFSFDWYLIGDGISRDAVQAEVERCEVAEQVHLLGARMNPYAYMAQADCLVITSVYEAQPMVANEALILDKPVISTEFASVREVIRNGENGAIVPQTPEAIAEAMARFMTDAPWRACLQEGACAFRYNNENELTAVEQLLS